MNKKPEFNPTFYKYEIMRRFFARHFPEDVHAFSRIRIDGDLDVYRWREDEYLWKQQKGKIAKYYSVYFDAEFITGFTDDEDPELVDLRFLKEMERKANCGLIVFYPDRTPEPEPPKQENPLEHFDTSTPERKVAKQVLKALLKAQKGTRGKVAPPSSSA